jgi:hypothetical protein
MLNRSPISIFYSTIGDVCYCDGRCRSIELHSNSPFRMKIRQEFLLHRHHTEARHCLCDTSTMCTDLEQRNPALRSTAPARLFETIARYCECAIQLLYLSADCQFKLQLSPLTPTILTRSFELFSWVVRQRNNWLVFRAGEN